MPATGAYSLNTFWLQQRGLIFPVLIAMSVLVIVIPLPPVILDLLLSANVTLAVVILLTTIFVTKPLEFSVFPSVLLGTTLARLVLNVASTRLILTRGASEGTAAAGGVIQAFGEFVAGGQVAVGLIIFVILLAIQFLVITKGATRIGEVAARFALDGMPGKQMAIDADLNAGIIKPDEAKRRREEVAQQADFYGAMDGASKFVRGDAIASIVITLINIAGGIYIGMVDNNMTLREASLVFTKLTIGDGLVTQVPAFLISLAAGLLATRSSGDSDLPSDVVGQTFMHPQAMGVAAVFLSALSFTGLPRLPLIILGSGLSLIAVLMSRSKHRQQKEVQQQQAAAQAAPPEEEKAEDKLKVEPIALELGFRLVRLADENAGGDLLARVKRVRYRIAEQLGLLLPKVRIKDNTRLPPQQYQIRIADVPVATGEAYPEALLAIDTGATKGRLAGVPTTDPVFHQPAFWIEPSERSRAELLDYQVIDPSTALITHLTEVIRQHSAELLSRQQVHALLDNLKQTSPKVVEELIPDLLKPAQVHQVLCNLLRERVSIRNLETILETLTDYAPRTKDLDLLTEYCRHGLARSICQQYRDNNRTLHVVTLDPQLEDIIAAGIQFSETGLAVKLSPQVTEALTRGIAAEVKQLTDMGRPAVLICSPQIRAGLRQITSVSMPQLAILSLNEVTRDTQVESAAQVSLDILNRDRQPAFAGAR